MSQASGENGMANVNGTRLYYEVQGAGRPILFLHGFTLDHRMWRAQAEVLAGSHLVVTYDARGFGRSMMPDTTPYKHCEDAAALCEHLGLRRVVAVGHSIGAHQTLELSLTRPDLVAGWVSICMAGLASVPFPADIEKMFAAIRTAARDEGIDAAKSIWSQCAWFSPAREDAAVERELDAILADYSGWHWTHDNPAKHVQPPAAQQLGDVRVPSLVISGDRDLAYNDAIARALLEGIPGATSLRLPNAGHMANMEDPEAINRAIDALARRAIA